MEKQNNNLTDLDLVKIINSECFGNYNKKNSCDDFIRIGNKICILCKRISKDKRILR
jgi:hypothetical protein